MSNSKESVQTVEPQSDKMSNVELTEVISSKTVDQDGSTQDKDNFVSTKNQLKSPTLFTSPLKGSPVYLDWENIQFSVRQKRNRKTILHGVSGEAVPGSMLALMGPSGAGKTSLLNILACRTVTTRSKSVEVTGNIRVNGKPMNVENFRKKVAYVMQEDVLYAYQTPREAFAFSAKLRLPASKTAKERENLVEWMISTLGLNSCADSRIGNIKVPGISGGEKKRTAIGIELISSPRIIFLDEPTSGLDSYAAFNVVKVLTELCNRGCTIIATIHQPSSEIFHLFKKTYLLAEGQTIFDDDRKFLASYLGTLGHNCPDGYNVADYVMFLMQQKSTEEIKEMAENWMKHSKANTKKDKLDALMNVADVQDTDADSSRPNCCVQMGWLSRRAFVNFGRDVPSLVARFAISAGQNLIVALVFFGVGRDYSDISLPESGVADTSTYSQLTTVSTAHFGILFFMAIGQLFGLAQPLLLNFPTERPIFLREHAVGTYHAMAYFLSNAFVEIPIGIIQIFVVYICTYWIVGLQGNFFFLVLSTALLGFVAASTAVLIGAIVPSVETAIQAAPLTFVPQMLFAGFFISLSLIPVWLRWAQYLCALKYGINILLLVEFGDLPRSWNDELDPKLYYQTIYGCDTPITNCTNRIETAMYPRNEIDPDYLWLYVVIMAAIFIVFRTIAGFILVARSSSFT